MKWQRRYTVLMILCCAYMLCYADRMVMASAIPFIGEDFRLSATTMGAVLSAFFAGYALMQLPGGLLADRFGPRVVLTTSIAWWSLMTAATGLAPGLASMLGIRVMFGVGEGPYHVAASKTLALWFPRGEVARANGFHLSASAIGATVAPLFVAAMILHWGWRSVFFALLLPGVVAASVIWFFIRDSPTVRPQGIAEAPDRSAAPTVAPGSTWESLLRTIRTPAVLWAAACLFFTNMVGWGLMNWLPSYLLHGRGFDVEKMGLFAALTNLSGAIGYPIGGYLCDRYFSQRLGVPIILGALLGAVFAYLAAVAPNGEWAVICLSMVLLLNNMASTAIFTLPLVVVPKQVVGSAAGIVNTAGQLAGVISPLLLGYVLDVTHGNFDVMLYCLAALTVISIYPATRIRQSAAFVVPS
jgi:sugar phosphate permease